MGIPSDKNQEGWKLVQGGGIIYRKAVLKVSVIATAR